MLVDMHIVRSARLGCCSVKEQRSKGADASMQGALFYSLIVRKYKTHIHKSSIS